MGHQGGYRPSEPPRFSRTGARRLGELRRFALRSARRRSWAEGQISAERTAAVRFPLRNDSPRGGGGERRPGKPPWFNPRCSTTSSGPQHGCRLGEPPWIIDENRDARGRAGETTSRPGLPGSSERTYAGNSGKLDRAPVSISPSPSSASWTGSRYAAQSLRPGGASRRRAGRVVEQSRGELRHVPDRHDDRPRAEVIRPRQISQRSLGLLPLGLGRSLAGRLLKRHLQLQTGGRRTP